MVALFGALSALALVGSASSQNLDLDLSPDSGGRAPSVDISLHKPLEFATLSTGGPKQPSTKILSAVGLADLNRLAETKLKEMEQYAQDALTNKVLVAREEMNASRQRFQAVADQVAMEVEARTARLEQQWQQLAVASGHGQVGKCCCVQDKDCGWHSFAAGGDRDCPVGTQDYRDSVKPSAKGLTSSGAVDTLLAQCVSSTGWTERPDAPAGGPAGSADEKELTGEPEIEITEGPGASGAAPATPEAKPEKPDEVPEELRDGTVLLPGGAGAAAPATGGLTVEPGKPEGQDAAADDVIHVELHVELPADEDLAGKDNELLEPVIPGATPPVIPESPLVTPEAPLVKPEVPAVEEEETPLVTPVKPEDVVEGETLDDVVDARLIVGAKPAKDPSVTPGATAVDEEEDEEDPPVKPGKPAVEVEEEEDPPVKPGKGVEDPLVKPGEDAEDPLVKPGKDVDVEEEDPLVKPGRDVEDPLVKPDVEEEDPQVKPGKLVNTEGPPEDPPAKLEDAEGRPIPVEFPDGSAESTRVTKPNEEEPLRDLDEHIRKDLDEHIPVIPETPLVKPEVPPVEQEEESEALPVSPEAPPVIPEAPLVKPQDGEGEPEDEEKLATPEVPVTVPGDGPGGVTNTTDSEEVEEVEMPLRPGDAPGSNGSGLPPPLEDVPWDAPGSNGKAPVQVPEMPEVPGNERPPAGGAGGSCEDTPGFLDERHEPCGAWAAYVAAKIECHRATEEIGFSQDGEDALIRNCPKSCGLCGESKDALAAEASTTPQDTTPQVTTTPETATTPGAVTPETTTPCDCDDMETVHVKITAVLTPKGSARSGGSLAQRAARRGRRTSSGCDCSGSVPPVHVQLAGPEGLPVAAVANALAAAEAKPDTEWPLAAAEAAKA